MSITPQPLQAWQWMPLEELPGSVVEFKREVYAQVSMIGLGWCWWLTEVVMTQGMMGPGASSL